MADIITIASTKGGVGKTTTSVNMSVILAERGYKVLFIDTDFQGNATTLITGDKWMKDTNRKKTFYDFLKGWDSDTDMSLPADRFIADTGMENLKIIGSSALANAVPKLMETLLDSNQGYNKLDILDSRLSEIRDDYDFIIIDTPPRIDDVVDSALFVCDYLIVPCSLNKFGVEGMESVLDRCVFLQNTEDCTIKVLGILSTIVEENTTASKINTAEIQKNSRYGDRYLKTRIHKARAVTNGLEESLPVVISSRSSRPSKEYNEFCDEILDIIRRDKEAMKRQEREDI